MSQVRKFDGLKFEFHKAFKARSNANIEAEKLRSQGYNVRVVLRKWQDKVKSESYFIIDKSGRKKFEYEKKIRFEFRLYKRKRRSQ